MAMAMGGAALVGCGVVLGLPDPSLEPLAGDAGAIGGECHADGGGSQTCCEAGGCDGAAAGDALAPSLDASDGASPPAGSACDTTEVDQEPCGKCGTHSRTCAADGTGKKVWGAWSFCVGELTNSDACDPSMTYPSEPCGNCGTRPRVCKPDCSMAFGDVCTEPSFNGEAACAPGSSGYVVGAACTGSNAGRTRTCDGTCRWTTSTSCTTFDVDPTSASIAVGADHACAIRSDHTVACWGMNWNGALGNGSLTPTDTPVQVTNVSGAQKITASTYFSCAIVTGGAVKCWGANAGGALGDGTFTDSKTPVAVSNVSGAIAIAAGAPVNSPAGAHVCAIVAGGAVKCWGHNDRGQLGDGTTTDSNTPVNVAGIAGATAIVAGEGHTCVVESGGVVKCWGGNDFGQCGQTNATVLSPTAVPNLSGAVDIAAGSDHTCAVLAGGTAACWGYNLFGQLGDGSLTTSATPVNVVAVSGVLAIAGGANHSCAVVAGGVVKCWGSDASGELGNGSKTAASPAPLMVQGLAGATEVSAGSESSCVRLVGGGAECWGGEALGSGISNGSTTPVTVVGIP